MKKIILSAIATFFITLLTGCGGGGSGGNTTPTPTPVTLTSIAITPASTTVAKGKTANLTAVGTYSNATTANLTSQVTWLSANPAVATINSTTGVATSVTVGNTNITASLNGVTSAAANLSVTAAVITGLTISPSAPTTPKGVAVTFTATGTYSDGTTGNASASVIWTSSATTVATLNTSGIASSLAQGTTSVTASANGVNSNVATLTVTAPALTAIAINPASATFAKGLTSSFTATGTYTDATTANITNQVTWVSANPAVATIGSNTGIATGVAIGSTTVSASIAGITAPAVGAAVTAAVIRSINIIQSMPSTAKGVTVTFTATGTYSDGSTGNISGLVTWGSTSPTVATLNTTGIASTLAVGTTSVTASTNGVTSNSLTLTVAPAGIVSFTVSPFTASIPVGGAQQFSAIETLTDGTVVAVPLLTPSCTAPALAWASSTPSVASICGTGLATGLTVGSSNITLSNGGLTSNAVVLSVTPPPVGTQMGGARQGTTLNLATSVTTFAGSAAAVCGVTDGIGIAARFCQVNGITTDGTNLYVVDTTLSRIRKIVISNGQVTTIAASIGGSLGTNSITTDGTNLYITGTASIYKFVIATGQLSTFAGSAIQGFADGIGAAASFTLPYGITTDGVSLYVSDNINNTIRKVVIATAQVTTLAGTVNRVGGASDGIGAAAAFSSPDGIATDGVNLYVADSNNSAIRKIIIATGQVTTLAGALGMAGSVDGIGSAARFATPKSITTDGSNLYVTDTGVIRKIVIATGQVTTLAGSPLISGSADGIGSAASFKTPAGGITTDGVSLYVADTWNYTIRKIQ